MGDISGIFGIIGLACGIYVFYACYQVKIKGEINTSVMLSKSIDPAKCSDKKAYLKEAFPKLLILAVSATAYGVTELLNTYVMKVGMVLPVTMVIAVIVLIWFAVSIMKMNKKYFK